MKFSHLLAISLTGHLGVVIPVLCDEFTQVDGVCTATNHHHPILARSPLKPQTLNGAQPEIVTVTTARTKPDRKKNRTVAIIKPLIVVTRTVRGKWKYKGKYKHKGKGPAPITTPTAAGEESETPGEPEPQQDITFKAEVGLGNNESAPLGLLHLPEIPIWPVPTDRPTRRRHGLAHRAHGPRRPKAFHILEEDLVAFTSMVTPAPVLYERDNSGEPGNCDVDTQDEHECGC